MLKRVTSALVLVALAAMAYGDWYEATGKPIQRSLLNSGDLRTEFALIESDIADKLPVLTGNGGKIVAINSGGTALEALSTGVPVASGGTGATTASGARTALGLAIGTDVQAYDAALADIAALALTDGNVIVGDGANWVAESGATARASLGLTIGTNVQAYDAELAAIAALTATDSNFIVGNGSTWVAESASTARTSLGLGSLATASTISNSNWSGTDLSVANGGTGASTLTGLLQGNGTGAITGSATISNSNWSGTDLAVTNGGTGSSTAADARTALGIGSIATRAITIQSGGSPSGGADGDIFLIY